MAKLAILALATTFLVAVTLVPSSHGTEHPKTVCYYESWAHWRQGPEKMDPEDLDTSLCTHIVYAYYGIDPITHALKELDAYLMDDLHDVDKFTHHKGQAKALIAIGGASQSAQFSLVASNPNSLVVFVESVVQYLTKHGFDGVMIDWSGMQKTDQQNFVKLLDEFDAKFAHTSFVLGTTLPATIATYDNYDVPHFIQKVDIVNVLTLDYNGPWDTLVAHASPLTSQLATLEAFVKRGVPRSKIVMAVPAYARTWKLASATKQGLGDKAISGGNPGPYTQTSGFLSYNELCVLIKANPTAFSLVRDTQATALYAVFNTGSTFEWISFEDTHTLAIKAKNITSQGYGGISLYSLSNEDVHGTCGKKNPLLHAINDNYNVHAVTEAPVVTITPPAKVTSVPVTNPPGVIVCTKEGFLRDPIYCSTYYECVKGDFGLEKIMHTCQRPEVFDVTTSKCVDRSKVPGC